MTAWLRPPATLALDAGEVHVWRATLAPKAEYLAQLSALLSSDERERAARFVFERDQRRFRAGRGFLRAVLGWYAGLAPTELKFVYGRYDKPDLAPETAGGKIVFNLSHSHELALCAVTAPGRRLGVDLEYARNVTERDAIARRYLCEAEQRRFFGFAEADRDGAFFDFWTRKEAFAKAHGDGLQRDFQGLDVTLGPGTPARLLSVDGSTEEAARWSLVEIEPGPSYKGCLAIEDTRPRARFFQWPDAEP